MLMYIRTYVNLNVRIKVYTFACVRMYTRRWHNNQTALNISNALNCTLP